MTDALDFQLYLMSYMRGRTAIDATLARLGVSEPEMQRAASRMGEDLGLDAMGHDVGLYCSILGAPLRILTEAAPPTSSDARPSQRYQFHLDLWPDFDFIVRSHPDGWAWGREFVRRADAPEVRLVSIDELTAWGMTTSEVIARFGAFAEEEAWNYGRDALYLMREGNAVRRISLMFDFELLQVSATS